MAPAQPPAIVVRIPAQIRRLYGTQSREEAPAALAPDVARLIAWLNQRYPGIGERLLEPDGRLRRWVNVYIDGEDVRALAGAATPLPPGAEVIFVPSIAGGVGGGGVTST